MHCHWLEHQALPGTSAVELALQDFLTDSQRAWLERFTKLYAQIQQSTL